MDEAKKNSRCLVLGGTGFIGSYVVHLLVQEGFEVTVLGRPDSDFGRISDISGDVRQLRGDYNDPLTFRNAVRGQDCVLHLVGATVPRTSMSDPVFDLSSNVIPTMHMLQEAHGAGVKRIVFASSGGTVYGVPEKTPIPESHPTDPLNVYGISKLSIEKMLMLWNKVYGMSNVVLRLSNVYGEGQPIEGSFGAISVFLGRIIKHEQITIWGDGSVVRDYVHVTDVAKAFLQALNIEPDKNSPTVFNIGSGIGVSLNDVIDIMHRITGEDADVHYAEGDVIDVPVNVLDISRASHMLGYRPAVEIEDGIGCLYEHMREELCV